MLNKFWLWYEREYRVIAPLTALLFLLQLVHLYWMTTNIVFFRLFGHPFWDPSAFWNTVIALVDYTEIPAIISSSVFYIHQYKKEQGRNEVAQCLFSFSHQFTVDSSVLDYRRSDLCAICRHGGCNNSHLAFLVCNCG